MKKLIILSILLLSGCASVSTFNGTYPPVSPNHVNIIIDNDDATFTPPCRSLQIAYIVIPAFWDQQTALNKARKEAAEVGADYIKAGIFVKSWDEALVKATAYKCISSY